MKADREKIILRNGLSPGDVVMLTAAVRDLHRYCPDRFLTDVRTPYPELWAHNRFITPLAEQDSGVVTLDCHYPLIQRSNQAPMHFLHGFIEFINERLRLRIRPTAAKGDIYLSASEKAAPSLANQNGIRRDQVVFPTPVIPQGAFNGMKMIQMRLWVFGWRTSPLWAHSLSRNLNQRCVCKTRTADHF